MLPPRQRGHRHGRPRHGAGTPHSMDYNADAMARIASDCDATARLAHQTALITSDCAAFSCPWRWRPRCSACRGSSRRAPRCGRPCSPVSRRGLQLHFLWRTPARPEPRLTAALPVENPYCSCMLMLCAVCCMLMLYAVTLQVPASGAPRGWRTGRSSRSASRARGSTAWSSGWARRRKPERCEF